eukprot:gene1764-29148_t
MAWHVAYPRGAAFRGDADHPNGDISWVSADNATTYQHLAALFDKLCLRERFA